MYRPITSSVRCLAGYSQRASHHLRRDRVPCDQRLANVVVISGASGEVGRPLTNQALESGKFDLVVALTSDAGVEKLQQYGVEHERLLVINRNEGAISDQLKEALPRGADKVNLIHSVGGTPKGVCYAYTSDQLRALNQGPAMAMVSSIGEFALDTRSDTMSTVNISSLAASYLEEVEHCAYSKSRLETEFLVNQKMRELASHGMHTHSGSLRVGFVMQEPRKCDKSGLWHFDTGYEGGMHHQANLPFVVGLGTGSQPIQPLHIKDLTQGAINALDHHSLNSDGFVLDGVTTGNTISTK